MPEYGHHLFLMDEPDGTRCPVCGWQLIAKKAEKILMIPLGPRVRNTLRHPVGLGSLEFQFQRDVPVSEPGSRWIQDSFDGRVHQAFNKHHGVRRGKEWRAMAWKATSDPFTGTETGASYTPTVLTNMSMHPTVRKMKGAMNTIMLFGKHFHNFQLAFRCVYFMFLNLCFV